MSNTIRIYPKGSDEHRRLELVASELTKQSAAGFRYSVEETYFDFGQDWKWTTIIVNTPTGDHWQILSPRQHAEILFTDDLIGTIRSIKEHLLKDGDRAPSLLTNVTLEYTGGGIYVYSALFNNEVWLYGGLDNYFGSYDIPADEIEEHFDCDYDSHAKKPSIPYPTWVDILESIRVSDNCDESDYDDAKRILAEYNPGEKMFEPCMEWTEPETCPSVKYTAGEMGMIRALAAIQMKEGIYLIECPMSEDDTRAFFSPWCSDDGLRTFDTDARAIAHWGKKTFDEFCKKALAYLRDDTCYERLTFKEDH